ncbi:hypothetical protein Pint_35820 [Pistacia integerrima]|uniref:Uncharacterized protein n=1 Tax=Pistacia integerrima TaxID=434235 RepID=A0ACC0Y1K8_9ROSI|nr:hypothetical protein Pint_35820 [Pistacia integerrima]
MESLRLRSPHSPLLHPDRHGWFQPPFSTGFHLTAAKKAPYIKAALSKPVAEISPAVTSREIPERTVNGDGDNITNAMNYLTNILASKVYDVAIESPLQFAPKLSERIGVKLWLKREDLQPVFSFKLRGAYNMMAKLPKDQLKKGVICSSAGNHAQGVALSAKTLGCDAVIAMPVTTPEIKWQSVKRLGAKVVLVGDSYDEAQAYAKKRAREEGRTFVPPFDHPDVIMGQGTIGMEIIRQMQGPLHAIFVPVGGGGLIAGIAAYVKRVSPQVCWLLCKNSWQSSFSYDLCGIVVFCLKTLFDAAA